MSDIAADLVISLKKLWLFLTFPNLGARTSERSQRFPVLFPIPMGLVKPTPVLPEGEILFPPPVLCHITSVNGIITLFFFAL